MTEFRRTGNHIEFLDASGSPLPIIACLFEAIEKREHQDLILDFSNVNFASPGFILPIIARCLYYREMGINFALKPPKEAMPYRMFFKSNWLHLFDKNFLPNSEPLDKLSIPAMRFQTLQEHFDAVSSMLDIMIGILPKLKRENLVALEWSLNEITDNVLSHSQSSIGGIVQIASFPKKGMVEFYVVDSGISIPVSLRSGRTDIHDDAMALRMAINERVTRSPQHQGNGLYGTFRCCQVSHGEFSILSGRCDLRLSKKGDLRIQRTTVPFNGTYVRASINMTNDEILQEALVFEGKKHVVGSDYIDYKYGTGSEGVQLSVGSHMSELGSRHGGRMFANRLNNLIDVTVGSIVIDFNGVGIISSSFADEVFGKLFCKLGEDVFNHKIVLRGASPVIASLIDRAIAQRRAQVAVAEGIGSD